MATDTLASWNEGPAKQAIIDFVKATTDKASPDFVPPEERIATFDQDGTLWVEHPMYSQVVYCLDFFGTNCIDFDRVAKAPIKLFVTATNVHTGRGHVFRNSDITAEVLLASACLPTMFQAIEIEGESYWDGGYSGNPTITPLVRECTSKDTILVQINPVERPDSPRTARDILNCLNEVSFNSALLKELRMIALLRQVANPGHCEGALWAGMRIHRVASQALTEFGSSSKVNAEWDFLSMLRDQGRFSASRSLPRCEWTGSGTAFLVRPRRIVERRMTRWDCRAVNVGFGS